MTPGPEAERALPFERSVFVNCPFDVEYEKLLRPLLFTIAYFNFQPRIASARSDSEMRLPKICELITACRYSVHDLSRLKATRKAEFSRMNMPFELGIDYGARLLGRDPLPSKKTLILEAKRYELMKALSDLSGIDVKSHGNEPLTIVRILRNWFFDTVGLEKIDSASEVYSSFLNFQADFYERRRNTGFSEDDLKDISWGEYIQSIREWLARERPPISGR
jgi:hypothetical protein